MKNLKIILAFGLVILFKGCIGFWDCYDRLTLIQENSNIVLIKDSSALFSNDDFDFILNECVTNCSREINDKDKSFIFINSNIIPNEKLILKKEYFLLTDSLNNIYKASQFRINECKYDSLMLLPDDNYRIKIIFSSDFEKNKYFYAPFKMNFAYNLLEEDTLKYILKYGKFGIKTWIELSEEWSAEK